MSFLHWNGNIEHLLSLSLFFDGIKCEISKNSKQLLLYVTTLLQHDTVKYNDFVLCHQVIA